MNADKLKPAVVKPTAKTELKTKTNALSKKSILTAPKKSVLKVANSEKSTVSTASSEKKQVRI